MRMERTEAAPKDPRAEDVGVMSDGRVEGGPPALVTLTDEGRRTSLVADQEDASIALTQEGIRSSSFAGKSSAGSDAGRSSAAHSAGGVGESRRSESAPDIDGLGRHPSSSLRGSLSHAGGVRGGNEGDVQGSFSPRSGMLAQSAAGGLLPLDLQLGLTKAPSERGAWGGQTLPPPQGTVSRSTGGGAPQPPLVEVSAGTPAPEDECMVSSSHFVISGQATTSALRSATFGVVPMSMIRSSVTSAAAATTAAASAPSSSMLGTRAFGDGPGTDYASDTQRGAGSKASSGAAGGSFRAAGGSAAMGAGGRKLKMELLHEDDVSDEAMDGWMGSGLDNNKGS